MLPSGGRRRSSMFDPDGEMMQKRKSRLDSMVSFSSDTDFDKMMTAMPKRRESRLAYENTYQVRYINRSHFEHYLSTTKMHWIKTKLKLKAGANRKAKSAPNSKRHLWSDKYDVSGSWVWIHFTVWCDQKCQPGWVLWRQFETKLTVKYSRSQATESTCAASIQVHVPIIYARACRQRLANTIKVVVE